MCYSRSCSSICAGVCAFHYHGALSSNHSGKNGSIPTGNLEGLSSGHSKQITFFISLYKTLYPSPLKCKPKSTIASAFIFPQNTNHDTHHQSTTLPIPHFSAPLCVLVMSRSPRILKHPTPLPPCMRSTNPPPRSSPPSLLAQLPRHTLARQRLCAPTSPAHPRSRRPTRRLAEA